MTRLETIHLIFEFDFVIALMLVGAWLERINGKYGIFDELLTPLPMGLGGLLIVFSERL